MGLGAATPAHRGALLWLVTRHCHLPLLAAQMTASGAADAGVLLEAKAAADTSACSGPWHGYDGCPLDTWSVDTEPCGDGYDSRDRGWLGVMCDAPGGRVVAVNLSHTGVGGELLPFFGRLGALLSLSLPNNPALRGDVADLAGAMELRYLRLYNCPLVVGEAAALAALVHLGEEYTWHCPRTARGRCDDGWATYYGFLWLDGSGVHGPVAALRALPGLGADWGIFSKCSYFGCGAAGLAPVAVSPLVLHLLIIFRASS